MKLDEDYKKVMDELQENFGWSNIDVLPESYQDLLNDTIMAVKNLTIQRVIKSLPDSDEIRMKARELDEKDFAQWMYELQKGNVL